MDRSVKSHPLWNDVEMGTDLTAQRGDKMASEGDAAIAGAKRAAIRKLEQELGIPPEQLPVEGFSFLTKVCWKHFSYHLLLLLAFSCFSRGSHISCVRTQEACEKDKHCCSMTGREMQTQKKEY